MSWFSGKRAIKIEGDLYQRLVETAGRQGYASVDEFVSHVLERAAGEAGDGQDDRYAEEQLRGLGYLE